MDFYMSGIVSNSCDAIFIVIDRLSKRHIYLLIKKIATAATAANLFYRYIWRFKGYLKTVINDCRP